MKKAQNRSEVVQNVFSVIFWLDWPDLQGEIGLEERTTLL